MTHSPVLTARYARAHRTIRSESLAVIVGGILVMLGGLLVEEVIVVVIGFAVAMIGVITWLVRASLAMWRRSQTPTLLFISSEGIGAILPDSSSIFLDWQMMRARMYANGWWSAALSDAGAEYGAARDCGLVITERKGRRVYVTRELSGYEELIAILVDYRVPIRTSGSGDERNRTGWRGGLELSAGGFSN
jgi:type IV secretory pathway TrbD component